ncbi:Techylectin-5B like protein [Argiope bruennichi]|uniref:Techylectin-5B like protein n=2 Tax=Argiope bruennichi TaxID=94029 RepID=A0A8T0ERT5_ARGBR|nr:Techylectin-5B like protein [Argiope bruennichi]
MLKTENIHLFKQITTIQDIIREDVDKIQQNQLLTKLWMEEQVQNIGRSFISRSEPAPDPLFSLANTDILTNLQILQSTLQGLRRMADTLQSSINIVKANLTDLSNVTRSISKYEKESLVNKSYLQSSLLTLADEKADPFLTGCLSPLTEVSPDTRLPRDCFEVQKNLKNETGVYRIQPDYARRPIFVFCDMETDGGGWTVFQRRKDGSIDFLRQWKDYKYGFGNIGGEFWLGNENLYLITHQDLYELRVDLEDFDGGKGFALYDGFAVGSEKEKYMLKFVGPFKAGDAGDGMTYHASIPFSTIDIDHDFWEGGHCAKDHTGGWWYNQCEASNLNGKYLNGLNPHEYQGVYWHEWHGPSYSLMSTKMMIRPKFREVAKPTSEVQEMHPHTENSKE